MQAAFVKFVCSIFLFGMLTIVATHFFRVTENEFLKASKAHPRLKTRLNNFHRQMDSMDKSDDDWVAIRPEWTTVDRIISSRSRNLIFTMFIIVHIIL